MTNGRVVSICSRTASMLVPFEDEIEPWPGGAPVCGFDYALGLEIAQDPHLVVEVWCQRIGTSDGTLGNHEHGCSPIGQGLSVRNLGS